MTPLAILTKTSQSQACKNIKKIQCEGVVTNHNRPFTCIMPILEQKKQKSASSLHKTSRSTNQHPNNHKHAKEYNVKGQ